MQTIVQRLDHPSSEVIEYGPELEKINGKLERGFDKAASRVGDYFRSMVRINETFQLWAKALQEGNRREFERLQKTLTSEVGRLTRARNDVARLARARQLANSTSESQSGRRPCYCHFTGAASSS